MTVERKRFCWQHIWRCQNQTVHDICTCKPKAVSG